ncbi:hypothetical protein [Nitrosomonas communis]|jgi:hypothetical protein|uniref:Uncharacterized protein n=1 Tax=Nitrosomonas communis TaxID=44574 RepID=A0A1I4LD85_9PROT|nr:hypothetical protein [Nitrosomonas communis]SFL88829.1 hypothetical protein SAMN05421863_100675 [Nitrosomonas communis]
MNDSIVNQEAVTLDDCIQHAKVVLDEQIAHIKSKRYDFAPQFKEMTIQLYLVGVMWQFYEKHDFTEIAREKAFSTLCSMMIKDGIKPKRAQKQVDFLKKISKLEDGDDALAIAIGRESQPGDESLAEIFDHYVDEIGVSGSLWRHYDLGKKIILFGGLLTGFAGVWFVTIFLPESSDIFILAFGLLTAFLFVASVSLIGLLIYRIKFKKRKHPEIPPAA